jgi:alginate O-acetyltransferase complex protein AlgI
MVFSSAIFLMLFLPVFLMVYYATPVRSRSLVILLASYTFYGWWRVDFLALLFGCTVFSYALSKRIKACADEKKQYRMLTFGVVLLLATLGYFKYFNFGIAAFNEGVMALGMQPFVFAKVVLPIGVSFYIFHCISYLVDVYRKDAEIAEKFTDFAAFIVLFPHLIAGPVLRYKDLDWQFRHRTHTWAKFNEGVIRFAMGFSKKVLIADTLAPLADRMFAIHEPTFVESWLGILAYAAQLYFDFASYSEMAVGLALMMGFRFIENFNQPYISKSITEFWRRWHISLSTWLRDYLYIPLGGNRKGEVRTYVNLFMTMLLGGLWHGANWTFILWGAWHGGILAIEKFLTRHGSKGAQPYHKLIALPLTFIMVMLGWVCFKAENISVAMSVYKGMFGLQGFALTDKTAWAMNGLEYGALVLAYVIVFTIPRIMPKGVPPYGQPSWAHHVGIGRQIAIMSLFLLAVMKMISQSYSPFLYFQF